MKADYEKLPRTQNTHYDLICMVKDRNGNAHFKKVGRGFPLQSESGGLRLKVELDLILKESLNSPLPTDNEVRTDASQDVPF